jgi:biopolymer transport protein ExbD
MKINLLDTEGPDVRIEIIPLIDVIFCILTFFILAAVSLTRQQAITLDLPKASTGSAQFRQMMVVSLDPLGQLYVEKKPVSREQLYATLLGYVRNQPKGLVVLSASQLASYNDVLQVLDLLRSVGGERVALATQPVGQPALSPQNPGGITPIAPPVTPDPGAADPQVPDAGGLPPLEGAAPAPGVDAPGAVSPGGAVPIEPQ